VATRTPPSSEPRPSAETGSHARRRAEDLPGVAKPRRYLPRFHWELLFCGVSGHELVGMGAARIRPDDALFARQEGEVRWLRCLRCDSWLPLHAPEQPDCETPPARDQIELPIRGRPLRDLVILRVIALKKGLLGVGFVALALALLLFSSRRDDLRDRVYTALGDLGAAPLENYDTGILHWIHEGFSLDEGRLLLVALALVLYAGLLIGESVGLWLQKRWAEYVAFVATSALLPFEVYELTVRLSPLKIVFIALNVAIVLYLLFAKRLFGLRGGAAAEERVRERDIGWAALERGAPAF